MTVSIEILEKVKSEVQSAIEVFKQNKDWNLASINGKVDVLQTVLVEVEKAGKEVSGMVGVDKKKLAVEIINSLIDIPMIPEWGEAILIEYVIDIVVTLFNKWFGHTWLDKILNG
jgi:hypothetical protein